MLRVQAFPYSERKLSGAKSVTRQNLGANGGALFGRRALALFLSLPPSSSCLRGHENAILFSAVTRERKRKVRRSCGARERGGEKWLNSDKVICLLERESARARKRKKEKRSQNEKWPAFTLARAVVNNRTQHNTTREI